MSSFQKPNNLSNGQMQAGQTLFQYLKRKKQIALRQSVEKQLERNKSLIKEDLSINLKDIRQKQPQITSVRDTTRARSTKRKQRKSSNKKNRADSSLDSKNSKKQNNLNLINIDNEIFKDDKTTRRSSLHRTNPSIMQPKVPDQLPRSRSPIRSFISMISPLKNRENLSSSTLSNPKQFDKKPIMVEERKSSFGKMTEFSTKKVIKQAMDKVQQHYDQQVEYTDNLKQRAREFVVMVNAFILHIEGSIAGTQVNNKKLNQLKSTMKQLNSLISAYKSDQPRDISHTIDSLYLQINQTLDTFEGNVQKQSLADHSQQIQKVRQQYEEKIEQMNKQKTRLGREINVLNKENTKIEKGYNKLLEKYNQLEDELKDKEKGQKQSNDEIQRLLQQKIHQLTTENHYLHQKIKDLQKQLKQSQHNFEQYKLKANSQQEQKSTARESYLLNELNMTKQQCANDINNITKYYTAKIEHYPLQIKSLEQTVEKQRITLREMDLVMEQKELLLKEKQMQRKQAAKKMQQSLVDMCRMNEELFKHWLALKDIKTLATRLGLYDRFQRIYKDVPFDDYMFSV